MDKDTFYDKVQAAVEEVQAHHLFMVGKLNARPGSNNSDSESTGVMGKHGVSNRNNNRERLLYFQEEKKMDIGGTLSNIRTSTSWRGPHPVEPPKVRYITQESGEALTRCCGPQIQSLIIILRREQTNSSKLGDGHTRKALRWELKCAREWNFILIVDNFEALSNPILLVKVINMQVT